MAIVQLGGLDGGDLFLDSFATAVVDLNVTFTSKLGRLILGLGCIVRQLDSAQIELHLQPRRQRSSLPGSRLLLQLEWRHLVLRCPSQAKLPRAERMCSPGSPRPGQADIAKF